MKGADHTQRLSKIMATLRAQDAAFKEPDPLPAEMVRLEALEEFLPDHISPLLLAIISTRHPADAG